MTMNDVEVILDNLPYDIIVFDGGTFPDEIYPSYQEPVVRYAKKSLSAPGFNFTNGWMSTDYDYKACDHLFNVLFTSYNALIHTKKRKLLSAIKKFR